MEEQRERRGKKTGWLVFLLLVLVLACGAGFLKWEHDRDVFFKGSKINGIDVSEMTCQQAQAVLEEAYQANQARILESGTVVFEASLAELGYELDQTSLDTTLRQALAMQKENLVRLIQGLVQGNAFQIKLPYGFSQDQLETTVTSSALTKARVPAQDAHLSYNKKKKEYAIVPEEYGTQMDDADLQALVKTETDLFLSRQTPGENLDIALPDSIYILPKVTAESKALIRTCESYNQYCKAKVVYQFGSQTKKLKWKTIKEWLIIGETETSLDEDQMLSYIRDLEEAYNTRRKDRLFTTSLGTQVWIPGSENDYGYTINEDGELSQLKEDLASNKTVKREPVYYHTNSYENPYYYKREGLDDLAGTYVEVNLSLQHLWFYIDGALFLESDFVSGCVARGHETQTGAFPLAYKESPSILVGTNANDGYQTKVQFWMPFYEGQGLHDATWRGSFGGNIYINNGSHGCVNLPYWAAEMIYNNIKAGTAIVIYK